MMCVFMCKLFIDSAFRHFIIFESFYLFGHYVLLV